MAGEVRALEVVRDTPQPICIKSEPMGFDPSGDYLARWRCDRRWYHDVAAWGLLAALKIRDRAKAAAKALHDLGGDM